MKNIPSKLLMENGRVNGLFYSINDKKLFWIPNYYTNGSGNLEQLLKNLKEGKSILRHFVKRGSIHTSEILVSRRYKSMWYFSVETEVCPKEAFEIGKDWTMWKWIQD